MAKVGTGPALVVGADGVASFSRSLRLGPDILSVVHPLGYRDQPVTTYI